MGAGCSSTRGVVTVRNVREYGPETRDKCCSCNKPAIYFSERSNLLFCGKCESSKDLPPEMKIQRYIDSPKFPIKMKRTLEDIKNCDIQLQSTLDVLKENTSSIGSELNSILSELDNICVQVKQNFERMVDSVKDTLYQRYGEKTDSLSGDMGKVQEAINVLKGREEQLLHLARPSIRYNAKHLFSVLKIEQQTKEKRNSFRGLPRHKYRLAFELRKTLALSDIINWNDEQTDMDLGSVYVREENTMLGRLSEVPRTPQSTVRTLQAASNAGSLSETLRAPPSRARTSRVHEAQSMSRLSETPRAPLSTARTSQVAPMFVTPVPSTSNGTPIRSRTIRPAARSRQAFTANLQGPCNITGSAVLANDQLVLLDQKSESLKLVSIQCHDDFVIQPRVEKEIHPDDVPFQVASAPEEHLEVAVTLPKIGVIDFIDIASGKTLKKKRIRMSNFKPGEECRAIECMLDPKSSTTVIYTNEKKEVFQCSEGARIKYRHTFRNPVSITGAREQKRVFVTDCDAGTIEEFSSWDLEYIGAYPFYDKPVCSVFVPGKNAIYTCTATQIHKRKQGENRKAPNLLRRDDGVFQHIQYIPWLDKLLVTKKDSSELVFVEC